MIKDKDVKSRGVKKGTHREWAAGKPRLEGVIKRKFGYNYTLKEFNFINETIKLCKEIKGVDTTKALYEVFKIARRQLIIKEGK